MLFDFTTEIYIIKNHIDMEHIQFSNRNFIARFCTKKRNLNSTRANFYIKKHTNVKHSSIIQRLH